jgi:hypothetical protein
MKISMKTWFELTQEERDEYKRGKIKFSGMELDCLYKFTGEERIEFYCLELFRLFSVPPLPHTISSVYLVTTND